MVNLLFKMSDAQIKRMATCEGYGSEKYVEFSSMPYGAREESHFPIAKWRCRLRHSKVEALPCCSSPLPSSFRVGFLGFKQPQMEQNCKQEGKGPIDQRAKGAVLVIL